MNDCVFCKIAAGEIPVHKVYEDDLAIAFLDNSPLTKGHTLVLPKSHYPNILETPDELVAKVGVLAKDLANNYKTTLGCEGFYFFVAGIDVHHYHQHIVPYYHEDDLAFVPNDKPVDLDLAQVAADLRND